jgi:RNA polymerase sigma-70 factor (ECF subfamily)
VTPSVSRLIAHPYESEAVTFDPLFERYHRYVAGIAVRLMGRDDSDVDDVVQDALVRAWQKRHLFDASRGTPTTWLLAITADRARAARRSRRRHLQLVEDGAALPDRSAPDPDRVLDGAVAALAPRQRLAVELHYFLDLSVADCAAVMNCSEGTVKSTLFDARARLRTALEDDHDA